MSTETLRYVYETAWALIAIVIGGLGFFRTRQTNEGNAKGFENWYKKTGLLMFKNMAIDTRKTTQFWVTKFVSLAFLILGILILFGFVNI